MLPVGKKEKRQPIEPYVVPPDFDVFTFERLNPTMNLAEPVNWKTVAPQLLFSRFLDLRSKLPTDVVQLYKKVGHFVF